MVFTLVLSITLVILTTFLLNKWIKKLSAYWPSKKVPVEVGQSILKRLITGDFSFNKQDIDMYTRLKNKGERYGGYIELWNPFLFVVDLDLMKNIMIKDFDYFSDHRGFATPAEPHLYLNLFNLKGEAWKDLRNKMSPAFTTGKLRRLFQIFDGSGNKLVTALDTHLTTCGGESVEMRPHLQNSIMDIIANAAFGVQTDIFENPENSIFKQMGNKVLNTFTDKKNIIKFFFSVTLPKIAGLLNVKLLDPHANQFFSQLVRDVVSSRKGQSGQAREDFLQIMLEAKESFDAENNSNGNTKLDFTEQHLIAQSIVFILGGFDTVDTLLSFAVYELAINQDIQEKLHKEIKKAIEGNDGQFSYDMVIYELSYLDQVVQETLRKYPPPLRLDRKVTRPYKVPDSDLVLPKDSVVIIPVYAIHHDPNIYPEPERFIPERFTKENIAARHICAFQGFGNGPRICIGNRFALAEAKFVLAHLILNFKLEPSASTVIPPLITSGLNLKPLDGVPLNLTRRL